MPCKLVVLKKQQSLSVNSEWAMLLSVDAFDVSRSCNLSAIETGCICPSEQWFLSVDAFSVSRSCTLSAIETGCICSLVFVFPSFSTNVLKTFSPENVFKTYFMSSRHFHQKMFLWHILCLQDIFTRQMSSRHFYKYVFKTFQPTKHFKIEMSWNLKLILL